VIIDPANIPDSEVPRVVYLIARSASAALRARGATDARLWKSEPTALAFWCGLTRGNLLVMLRILTAILKVSDARTGSRKRDKIRFYAARKCLAGAAACAELIPPGPVHGIPPLKI
jgi:hypothetical protein